MRAGSDRGRIRSEIVGTSTRLKHASKRRSHRVMQPLEFMARLASIVAPPRLPLARYHGVLAPNSSWRRQIVAQAAACRRAQARFDRASHRHAGMARARTRRWYYCENGSLWENDCSTSGLVSGYDTQYGQYDCI